MWHPNQKSQQVLNKDISKFVMRNQQLCFSETNLNQVMECGGFRICFDKLKIDYNSEHQQSLKRSFNTGIQQNQHILEMVISQIFYRVKPILPKACLALSTKLHKESHQPTLKG